MSTFEERRLARNSWPIRKLALRDEELTDSRLTESIDERLRLVRSLTMQQWAFAGKVIPRYTRAEMPGQITRRFR